MAILLNAQTPIRFGDREVYLEPNVGHKVRGNRTSSLELGLPTVDRLNVLVQFESGKISYETLKQKGIVLADYLGANAYYASIIPGSRPSDFAGTGLRAVVPIRGEWKVVNGLLSNTAPTWAVDGENFKVTISWFKDVTTEMVKADLKRRGLSFDALSSVLGTADIVATREQVLALAEVNYVAAIRWIEPPMELDNFRGARLGGAKNLRMSPELGGRGLTGKGVRIGIWDGNVADHVDYGNRVHRKEFEVSVSSSGGHGMHTTGSILGAGLLDERARGMAPEAEIWTWNFNTHSNKKSVPQEMLESYEQYNISLTSNSYGLRMSSLCDYKELMNYTVLGNSNVDILSYYIPTLTHSYSAGNSQGACSNPFSHATNYAKNIISVAALTVTGEMTDFSSFGPLLDGRLFPIISTRGENVYSTMPEQTYNYMSGTSMACPTATGHLALLTQRWGQLHGGAIPYNYYLKALIANTADDKGNIGPDYKFGFGNLNAIAAVTAMEHNWHSFATLKKGGAAQTSTINVPAGVKELRVMICWNDPVARKEYATGDCPLVNDLDLTVEANGKTYFPYTLDYKNPKNPAVATKKNEVDNIEQVVVTDPAAGVYTVKVEGKINQEDEQDYVVVWYFDYKRPAITSPMNGDVYTPGNEIFLRTENLAAKLKVELSTDGGSNYSLLKEGVSLCDSILIPEATPATSKATLRITDANGKVVKMTGVFTIMTRASELKLEEAACETTGWKLTWKAAKGAARYEILRADVNKGSYDVIATVENVTEYILEASAIHQGERNIYAVRALNADGVRGERSIAVFARNPSSKSLTIKDLPYVETFVGTPAIYATTTAGKNLSQKAEPTPVSLGFPFDSHYYVWQASKSAATWEDPFTSQLDNVGTLSTCSIDLTGVPAETKLNLRVYYYMDSNIEKGALLRLLINGEEKADVFGNTQIVGDKEEHFATWDLTSYAGKKIVLKFETALAKKGDRTLLVYYQLDKTSDKKDVGIAWTNEPPIKAKPLMQDENITFKVLNFSANEVKNVPVSVQVDGKVVYTTVIETLKPFEDKIYTIEHNFASEEPHIFDVLVRVSVEGDTNPTNDEESFEVYNMGQGIVMPELTYTNIYGIQLPTVPRVSVKLSGKKLFTDGQGTLGNYKVDENAFLQLVPTLPSAAIQVTFKKINLNEGDTLYVYTGEVNVAKVKTTDTNIKLTGSINDPLTYLAEFSNGALTIGFDAQSGELGEGWIAEVSEVPMSDQWQIMDITEVEGTDANHKKLNLKIKNLLPVPFKGVALNVGLDGVFTRHIIPELKASAETNFVIPEEINVTEPMRMEVDAGLPFDGNTKNNRLVKTIIHDPIWNGGGTIKTPATLTIKSVCPEIGQKPVDVKGSTTVVYMPDIKVPLYTKGKNAIEFVLAKKVTAETATASIRVFADFDDNKELDEVAPELLAKRALEVDKDTYVVIVDLSSATGLKLGEHRMRIVLADDENYTKFKNGQEIEWGHVVDFTADLKEGHSPSEFELALEEFVDLSSGRDNLTATTPVKVKITNNGLLEVKKVKLALKVDEKKEVEEEFNCSLAPQGGSETLTFVAKADLAVEGKHKVVVTLKDKDGNDKDNVLSGTFYKIVPKTSNLYALNFVDIQNEGIVVKKVGKEIGKFATIEGWWKINEAQTSAFVTSGQNGIYIGSFVGNAKYAPNSLVVAGGKAGYLSVTPPLVPGKWHHIAVSMKQRRGWAVPVDVQVKVYVDGVAIKMKQIAEGSYEDVEDFDLNSINGQNAMFRIWNIERTENEIKGAMTQSVRTAGNLPAGCLGEYIYTEGKGNASAYGDDGNNIARIVTKRPDNEVWKQLDKVLRDVEVEGQVLPAQINGSNVTITMSNEFTAFDKVKVNFLTHWADVTIKNGSTSVENNSAIDFSAAPEKKLTFTLEKDNFFGVKLSEQVTIQVVNDKSTACELLTISMPKEKNPGLKTTILKNNPEQLIVLEPEAESADKMIDPKKVVLVVSSLSPNAKLFNGETEIALNSEMKVDLSSALTLKVVAQNERNTKNYTVRLAINQSVVWDVTKLERVYQATPLKLDATTTSGLPVSYLSLDPTIATVDADGNLITVGVGTTKIVASQVGNELYKEAETKSREIEVKRADLTIKVKDATMAQGDELPELEFEFEGLAFPNTESQFDAPYEIQMKDGKVWNVTMPPLAVGEYTIAPKGYKGTYDFGGYKVTRTSAKLTVTPAKDAKEITFAAKDESNKALAGVKLQINDLQAETSTKGLYMLYMRVGKYSVTATKEGYAPVTKDFTVENKNLTVELQLLKEEYTLTYSADENGLIQGLAVQKVAKGRDGVQVVAVPKTIMYRFKQWNDGKTDAARIDKAVQGDITVKAEFELNKYTLTYEVGEGGDFENPALAQQTVDPEMNGQEVKVIPKAGYVFLGWSDGLVTPTRKELKVTKNMTVKAEFFKPYVLAWSENFELGDAALKGWTLQKPKTGLGWHISEFTEIVTNPNSGNKLVLAPQFEAIEPVYTSLSAASPWLSIEARPAGAKVVLSYVRYIKPAYYDVIAKLEYCFDDGEWKDAAAISRTPKEAKTEKFELDDATIGTNKYVRFRWTFGGSTSRTYCAIDDIRVSYDPEPGQVTLRYLAGEHGTIQKSGETTKVDRLELTTVLGTDGPEVTALPDEGYQFEKWSDGMKTQNRKDNQEVSVTAIFMQTPKPLRTITYLAGEHGSISGIAYQQVQEGAETSSVTATGEGDYVFKNWDDGKTDNPRTDIAGTADKIFTAQFAQRFTLTYVAGEGGSIEGVLSQNVFEGENGTEVVAKPNEGYHFVKWDDGVTTVNRTEKNVSASKEYKALFSNTYAVTLAMEGKGKLVVTGYDAEALKAVRAGTELTVVATPELKWTLKSLVAGATDIKTTGKFTVTSDVEVKAVFEKKTPVADAVFANTVVAPNPFENLLRVTNAELRGTYKLLNAQGVVVRSGNIDGIETIIETADLTSGLYLLHLTAEDGATKTYSVVKQ